jgi:hypothetical protein
MRSVPITVLRSIRPSARPKCGRTWLQGVSNVELGDGWIPAWVRQRVEQHLEHRNEREEQLQKRATGASSSHELSNYDDILTLPRLDAHGNRVHGDEERRDHLVSESAKQGIESMEKFYETLQKQPGGVAIPTGQQVASDQAVADNIENIQHHLHGGPPPAPPARRGPSEAERLRQQEAAERAREAPQHEARGRDAGRSSAPAEPEGQTRSRLALGAVPTARPSAAT